MSLELKPEKVKPYLKFLAEAILNSSNNEGSLRKDIWNFLNNRYQDQVDYRDFLLAIRKFLLEGKMLNNDGLFSMHPEVLNEVKEKTPTPAVKAREGKASIGNPEFKSLASSSAENAISGNLTNATSKKSAKAQGSAVSNSGKKQKVKPSKESARQSKIEKYFMKKQLKEYSDYQLMENSKSTKGLGFATPATAPAIQRMRNEHIQKQLNQGKKEPKEMTAKQALGIQAKLYQNKQKNQMRKKMLEHNLAKATKTIKKYKKIEKETTTKLSQASHKIHEPQPQAEEIKKIEKAPQVEHKVQNKLTQKVIKALKQAVQKKDIKPRKQFSPAKKYQKTKAIKKIKGEKAKKKLRALTTVKGDREVKILAKRLRGKTLDLTKLGIIKEKKVPQVEFDKKAKEYKAKNLTPQKKVTKKSHSSISKKVKQPKSARKSVKLISPISSRKTTPKHIKKTSSRVVVGKTSSAKKQKEVKRKIKQLKRQLFQSGSDHSAVGSDRKAKLDCVKALRQLFTKKCDRENMYVDEKLIYV